VLTFRENDDLAAVLARPCKSTLLAYFELCARDPEARSILYHDIPRLYTFHRRSCTWQRKRGNDQPVGRMVHATPAQGERFYLRLLLTQVAGARSFEEMKSFQVNMCSHIMLIILHLGVQVTTLDSNALNVSYLQIIVTILFCCHNVAVTPTFFGFYQSTVIKPNAAIEAFIIVVDGDGADFMRNKPQSAQTSDGFLTICRLFNPNQI